MDAGRCCNVDIAVGDERVVCPMVDASGKEVEKFEAVNWLMTDNLARQAVHVLVKIEGRRGH